MSLKIHKLLFDRRDHELIRIVNDVVFQDGGTEFMRQFYSAHFHPHGIKEMVETKGLRAAFCVAQLLKSLEFGGVDDRLNALRSLRQEVVDTAEGPLAKNTARVLLQIMKDLVRAHGDYGKQLALAHKFRRTATGKPRIVRQQLHHFHLLEMPEAWNQITFDDHVHDANTKGRKSATHLIMDAWIKGIRRLRVIYYNFIESRFATELLEASRILDVDIRIGIEFSCRYRNKYVQLIWVPRGFADTQSFLCFLAEAPVIQLMQDGRCVSMYQQTVVMDLLNSFNDVHLSELNQKLDVDLTPIVPEEFLLYVGIGQKSKLHLSKFIHDKLLVELRKRVTILRSEYIEADTGRREEIATWVENANKLDLESIIDGYLSPEKNPETTNPDIPADGPGIPKLLRLTPFELLSKLSQIHTGYRLTLNLTNLKVEDVLELIYDCQGMISRLEIFNLKDHAAERTAHLADICRLMQAINEGSTIHLKQVIREIIDRLDNDHAGIGQLRVDKLKTILHDIEALQSFYGRRFLKARIGSDSTGRSPRVHGMGLAIEETLPKKAQKSIKQDLRKNLREIIPIHMTACKTMRFLPKKNNIPTNRFRYGLTAMMPANGWMGLRFQEGWEVDPKTTRMTNPGNIVTLGGVQKIIDNKLFLNLPEKAAGTYRFHWRYLNSNIQNALKVIIGFIPAFLTFALTKDWWVLVYFGAFIWFGITGLRNILQSVLGGGGFKRSSLLKWNAYISWDRVSDSLLYTGFSVPLLDYLVKTVVLDRIFGIDAGNHPALLYTFIALANGIYLSTHNVLRGLPKGAVFGNLFRSILSIPIAIGLNSFVGCMLTAAAIAEAGVILQKWAAIISKFASDIVAGIIEGLSDRQKNIQTRLRDYRIKLNQLLDVYARLETLYPDVQTLRVLDCSTNPSYHIKAEARDLEKIIMIHALDLLYFWMYQPRSRTALRQYLTSLSEDERQILVSSQDTLQRCREISQLLLDGALGPHFQRPLSLYLSLYKSYLKAVKRLIFDVPSTGTVLSASKGFTSTRSAMR